MYQLFDYQIPNVNETKTIFTKIPVCFNLSGMGLGKSIIAYELSRNFTHTFIISYPAIIDQNWTGIVNKYSSLDNCSPTKFKLLSINALHGMKNSRMSHRFLTREDRPFPRQSVTFAVTSEWRQICREGVLVVIDEMQLCKNDTLSSNALKALLEPIMEDFIEGENNEFNIESCLGKSRILMMSGTPIDEYEQISNYFSVLNLSHELLCKHFGISKNTTTIDVFKYHFLPQYSSSMIPTKKSVSFKGAYCIYNTGITFGDISSITKSQLAEIELTKVPIFASRARELLLSNPKRKVVIGFFFRESFAKCAQLLRAYSPGVIIGSTSKTERTNIINNFQKPNEELRIIIANVDIIKEGINLDDENGEYPRSCIVNIGYMPPHQLLHRFHRANTKSDCEIEIILCREIDERSLHESQHRKCNIMSDFSESIYPNNYDIIER